MDQSNSEQTKMSSTTASTISNRNTASPDFAPERPDARTEWALLALINRSRALNGWKMVDAKSLEKRMLIWWDQFRKYDIPTAAYPMMLDMAFDDTQRAKAVGKEMSVDASLLVSTWTRSGGIRDKMREEEIRAGRTLPENSVVHCPHCEGSGLRIVIRNGVSGRGGRCDHTEVNNHP